MLLDLTEIERAWQERMKGIRADAAARRMLPIVLAHPVFDAKLLAEGLDVSLPRVYAAIKTLLDRGLIAPAKAGR